jgi:hypothetical protein
MLGNTPQYPYFGYNKPWFRRLVVPPSGTECRDACGLRPVVRVSQSPCASHPTFAAIRRGVVDPYPGGSHLDSDPVAEVGFRAGASARYSSSRATDTDIQGVGSPMIGRGYLAQHVESTPLDTTSTTSERNAPAFWPLPHHVWRRRPCSRCRTQEAPKGASFLTAQSRVKY